MQYRIVPNLVYDINTDNANKDDFLDLTRYIRPELPSTPSSAIPVRITSEIPCECRYIPQYDVPADYGYRPVPGTLPDDCIDTLPADYGYTNPYNYPTFDKAYPTIGKTYPTVGESYPTVDKSFERYTDISNEIAILQSKIKEEEEDILVLDKMIYKKKDKISDYEREIVRLKSMYNK